MFRRLIYAALLVAALGALTAPAASALKEQCAGASVKGLGSFLQQPAQTSWSGSKEELGFNGSPDAAACSGTQGSKAKPKVSYVPTGSNLAMRKWGAEDAELHTKDWSFLGTDEAPTGPVGEEGTMLANMKAALGSDVVVAPVAQTSIAIVAHPPQLALHSVCVVPRMTGVEVEQVFAGVITNWRQLASASDTEAGGDCDQAISRVVREEASGTTYQFKHYLHQINPEPLECTGEAPRTWAQLQSSREPGELNKRWPEKVLCQEGEGPVTVHSYVGEGSAAPVEYVKSHAGTITYSDLPTAMMWPEGLTRVGNGAGYADPNVEGNEANCAAASYSLPSGWESGLNVDWSGVYGSDPKIGEEAEGAYPLCTLTWAVAAADSGGVFGNGPGTTVRDYLKYVNSAEGGRNDVLGHWYSPLPGPVVTAAEAAIANIGGEGEEEEPEEPEEEESKTGTVLCKVAPELKAGVLDCPKGEGFGGKVTGTVYPETIATLTSTAGVGGTVSCAKGGLTGEFKENGTSAGGGLLYFMLGNTEGCTTTLPEEPEAVVEFPNLPFEAAKFVYLGALAPQGAFVWAKGGGGQLEMRVAGIGAEGCVYSPSFLSGQIVNGSPSKMIITGSWQWIEGPGACPEAFQQSAQMTVARMGEGLPLYIAGE